MHYSTDYRKTCIPLEKATSGRPVRPDHSSCEIELEQDEYCQQRLWIGPEEHKADIGRPGLRASSGATAGGSQVSTRTRPQEHLNE